MLSALRFGALQISRLALLQICCSDLRHRGIFTQLASPPHHPLMGGVAQGNAKHAHLDHPRFTSQRWPAPVQNV